MTIQDTIPIPVWYFKKGLEKIMRDRGKACVCIYMSDDGRYLMQDCNYNIDKQEGDLYYFRIKLKTK